MADRQQLYIAWCSNRIIYGINAGKPFTCVGTRLGNTLLSINVSRRFFFLNRSMPDRITIPRRLSVRNSLSYNSISIPATMMICLIKAEVIRYVYFLNVVVASYFMSCFYKLDVVLLLRNNYLQGVERWN